MNWFKAVKESQGTGDFHFKTNKEREAEMYEIMQEKMPSHGFVQGKKKETWYRFDGQYLFCIRICMRYGEATLQYSVVSLCSSFEFLKMPSKDFYEGLSYKKTQHVNAQLQYNASHHDWRYVQSKADPGVSFPIEYVRSWTAAEDVVALLDHMVLPFFAAFRGGPTVLQCALSGGRDPSIYTRFASADLDGKKHMMVQLLALQPDRCPPVAQLFYAFGEDDALRLYYEYCKAQEVMLVPEKKAASVEEGEKKADTFPREAVDEAVKYGFETGDFSRMDALLEQIQKQNFALLRKCVPALFEGKEATYTPLRRQAPLPPAWAEGKAKSPQQGPCRESGAYIYSLLNLRLNELLEQEGFCLIENIPDTVSYYRQEGDKVFAIHFPAAGLQSVRYDVLYLYEGHPLIWKGQETRAYLENCLYADWRYEALPWGEDYTFPYLKSLDLCESYALKRYAGQLQEVVLPFFRHFRGEQDLLTAWEAEFAHKTADWQGDVQPRVNAYRNEKVNQLLLFSCYRAGKEE